MTEQRKGTPAGGSDTAEPAALADPSAKGLAAGSLGLLACVVLGISTIAPVYTLTGALGPTVREVGVYLPAVFIVGFLPMLLVALGYRELNAVDPDSGTSFTWSTRAFGPMIGWIGGLGAGDGHHHRPLQPRWRGGGLLLPVPRPAQRPGGVGHAVAAPAGEHCHLLRVHRHRGLDQLPRHRHDHERPVRSGRPAAAGADRLFPGGLQRAPEAAPVVFHPEWFNPFNVESFSAFAAGLSLSIFIFWGWDVCLTVSEESVGSQKVPGRAATVTVLLILLLYLFTAAATLQFAGISEAGPGPGQSGDPGNVFAHLAGPVMGPLAILMSIAVLASTAASLQSTFISPARTLLAMGYYGAVSRRFAHICPRSRTPRYATVAPASPPAASMWSCASSATTSWPTPSPPWA